MAIHHFVRLRPAPDGHRGIREMIVGGRHYSADSGWVLLERGEAVSLRCLHHPDEKARYMFSYAFDVVEVEYPEGPTSLSASFGRPADAQYEARLSPLPWNEFRVFPYAGRVFTPEAGWLPVTRDQADFLSHTRAQLEHKDAPPAFLTRVVHAAPVVSVRATPAGPVPGAREITNGTAELWAATPDIDLAPTVVAGGASEIGLGAETKTPLISELRSALLEELRAEMRAHLKAELSAYQPDPIPENNDGAQAVAAAAIEPDPQGRSSALSIDQRLMDALGPGPLAAADLAAACDLQRGSGYFKRRLAGLVERGVVELTIPDKPASPAQQYRLVEADVPQPLRAERPGVAAEGDHSALTSDTSLPGGELVCNPTGVVAPNPLDAPGGTSLLAPAPPTSMVARIMGGDPPAASDADSLH